MGKIETALNIFKELNEYKKEYEKKHDKDLYISRLEDFLSKAETENSDLNNKIEKMEKKIASFNKDNRKIEFNNFNLKLLEMIYENNMDQKEFEQWVEANGKDCRLAFDKLKMLNYIFINDKNKYDFCENRKLEIITALEEKRELEALLVTMNDLNNNSRGY